MRSLVAALILSAAVVSPAFAAPASPGKTASAITANKKEKDSFTVELKAAAAYKKGVEGTVELVLKSKGAHHVNPDYPAKFKVADPPPAGVTFPKMVLKKEDGKFDEHEATIKIPFTAANAGKTKIAGVFQFSVCSDKNCFMEKVDLDVEVDVK